MDYSDQLRRAVIKVLRSDVAVSAMVGARVNDQVYAKPVWPFIRYGLATFQKFEASCWDGSEHSVLLHTFAKGPGTSSCAQLNAAVVKALDGAEAPIALADNLAVGGSFDAGFDAGFDIGTTATGLSLLSFDWVDTQVINDTSELGAYHGIIQFSAQVVAVTP